MEDITVKEIVGDIVVATLSSAIIAKALKAFVDGLFSVALMVAEKL